MKRFVAVLMLISGLLSVGTGYAAQKTFDLTWTSSGSASATGSITLNDTALATGASCRGTGAGQCNVTAFTITVTGDGAGNGTWTLSDFDSNFNVDATTAGSLNTNIQLYGQVGSRSVAWQAPGNGTDGFYFFNNILIAPNAPGSITYFEIRTRGGLVWVELI